MISAIEIETKKRFLEIAGRIGPVAMCGSSYLFETPDFFIWSGASKPFLHHYGKGGLARHTMEVINLCLEARKQFPQYEINETELFLAALYHDSGKLYDYKPLDKEYKEWGPTKHKRYIHHISRSAIMWTQAITPYPDIAAKYHEPVLHAILSHHCTRPAGSPVAPKTRVAWLVHLCDSISARLTDADTMDVITGEI